MSEAMLTLREARAEDCEALTELCLRSKAVWGYDAAFMDQCRAELTLKPNALRPDQTQVAERGGRYLGVAQISTDGNEAYLEKLFVDPDAMGQGIGRALIEWARSAATRRGALRLVIEADPDAAPFYRRIGAVDAGVAPSASIPGRVLPMLVLSLVE